MTWHVSAFAERPSRRAAGAAQLYSHLTYTTNGCTVAIRHRRQESRQAILEVLLLGAWPMRLHHR